MAFAGYHGLDPDDMESLNALASSTTRRMMSFSEAYALLTYGSPRDVAERAWNDFVAYYNTDATTGAQTPDAGEIAPGEYLAADPRQEWLDWQYRWNEARGYPYLPGRTDLPACLWDLWIIKPDRGPEFYAHAVASAWTLAELPMHTLSRKDWVDLWREGRYVHDGQSAPRRRRRRPVRLYRVALAEEVESSAIGLSWTADLGFAETFKRIRDDRYPRLGAHLIITAVAAPAMILGELTAAYGRGEPEFIADIPAAEIQHHPMSS